MTNDAASATLKYFSINIKIKLNISFLLTSFKIKFLYAELQIIQKSDHWTSLSRP